MDTNNEEKQQDAAMEEESTSTSDENSNGEGNEGGEDFHAKELERLQGEKSGSKYSPLEKAVFSAKKIAEQIRQYGGDPADVFGAAKEKDEPAGSEGKDIEAIIDEKLSKFTSGFVVQQSQAMIRSLAKSDSEANLIQYHLENTIRPTGNLENDIKAAYLLANQGRLMQLMELTKEQAQKKASKPIAGQQSNETAKGSKQPTEAQKAFMKRRGLEWDSVKGQVVSPSRKKFVDRVSR